ncbi:helix-turn-helix domain-containing protein [Argonema antarcticum]|uniref:helix-turn-helix domain-containing protein n=1 Tax=Argonema antarcticum TaxID=2942763 RepID=UPI0020128F53|nr:helix-turn-helix domain-containing protein [Argonema antarcticum]MCL1473171.1 helix-turn-helix domain-containing protein [Argonema antarcticum A004/B2]
MNQSPLQDYTHQLQSLMQVAGVSSFKALSRKAGVSERQVMRLRRGEVMQMRLENILKLSQALEVPVSELLATFGACQINWTTGSPETAPALQQEYERLLEQMEEQRQSLMQEFVQSSLEVLESWLIQWPTAAYAAGQNQALPAVKLLPLLRPVEQLVQQWGVEALAPVGAELPYDPHQHQLMELTAQPGDPIKVRYTGYRQGDRLLYRAKVSPIQSVEW